MQCRNDVPEAPTPTLSVLSTHHSQSISGVDTAPGYEDKNESFESILSPVRADSNRFGAWLLQTWRLRTVPVLGQLFGAHRTLCSSSWSWQNLTAPKEKKKKKSQIARSPTSVSLLYTRGNWMPDCTQSLTICKQALSGDPESDRYKSRRS